MRSSSRAPPPVRVRQARQNQSAILGLIALIVVSGIFIVSMQPKILHSSENNSSDNGGGGSRSTLRRGGRQGEQIPKQEESKTKERASKEPTRNRVDVLSAKRTAAGGRTHADDEPQNGGDDVLTQHPPAASVTKFSNHGDNELSSLALRNSKRNAATRVRFQMSNPMEKAWATSDKRLTFDTEVSLTASGEGEEAVVVKGKATFYGKSSLKLKYTKRRSIQMEFSRPVKISPGAPAASNYVLLSLWEDKTRMAYRSSLHILQKLGLFYAHASMVELSCRFTSGSLEDTSGSSGGYKRCSEGSTLGAYLMIEYPSDAIVRSFSNKKGDAVASALSGVCDDTPTLKTLRTAALNNEAGISGLRPKKPGQPTVGTRNWFYFEKPAIYDILDVPSFKRNSSLSKPYRAAEKKLPPRSIRLSSTINDAVAGISNQERGGADGGGSGTVFDLSKYMLWVATNTILQNGDYDDEVFVWAKGSYMSMMAWDYDSIFSECHRQGTKYDHALKTKWMYCAETPLEKIILGGDQQEGGLKAEYQKALECAVNRGVSRSAWKEATDVAGRELRAIFDLQPNVIKATFDDQKKCCPSVDDGLKTLRADHSKSLDSLKKNLPQLEFDKKAADFLGEENHEEVKVVGEIKRGGEGERDHEGVVEKETQAAAAAEDKHRDETPKKGKRNTQKRPNSRSTDQQVAVVQAGVKRTCSDSDAADTAAKKLKNNAAALKPEVKKVLDAKKFASVGSNARLFGPTGEDVLKDSSGGDGESTSLSQLTKAGLYCAQVLETDSSGGNSGGDCEAHRVVVLRGDRGSAEFGLFEQEKPNFDSLTIPVLDYPRSNTHSLKLLAPRFWPQKSTPIPLVASLRPVVGAAVGDDGATTATTTSGWESNSWLRVNARMKVTSSGAIEPTEDVGLIRGFSAINTYPLGSNIPEVAKPAVMITTRGSEDQSNTGITVELSDVSSSSPLASTQTNIGGTFLFDDSLVPEASSEELEPAAGTTKAYQQPNSENGDVINLSEKPTCVLKLPRGATFKIKSGTTVRFGAGCVIILGHKASLTIDKGGKLIARGTEAEPVSFIRGSGIKTSTFWDSIVVSGGGKIDMSYTFISGSGAGQPRAATGTHHKTSAAITLLPSSSLVCKNCFFLNLNGPAFAAGKKSTLVFERSLIQWATMGGECILCDFKSIATVWTNFPRWSGEYVDEDNDGLYLSGGKHIIEDSVIANTYDDGIDSGTPEKFEGDGGFLDVRRTIIENVAHEGIALSSSPKGARAVTISRSCIQHAQQGIEIGYSGSLHTTAIDGTVLANNQVGIRYGDNYRISITSKLSVGEGHALPTPEGSGEDEGGGDGSSPSFTTVLLLHNFAHTMNYLRKSAGPAPEDRVVFGRNVLALDKPSPLEKHLACSEVFPHIGWLKRSSSSALQRVYPYLSPAKNAGGGGGEEGTTDGGGPFYIPNLDLSSYGMAFDFGSEVNLAEMDKLDALVQKVVEPK